MKENRTLSKPKKLLSAVSGAMSEAMSEEKRTSAMMDALRAVHSAASPDSMDAKDLERQRRGHELLGRLVSPTLGLSWEPFEHEGLPMAWVRPERGHDPNRVVLYCHGGGYTAGTLQYSRILASKTAQVTGHAVLCFAYRLAPEHPYPAAVEDALHAWDYLMHLGYGARDTAVLGDSAGGNLALVLTLRLREAGRRLPRRMALFSPWTDMTCTGESYALCRDLDPMLTANYIHAVRHAYAAGRNLRDAHLSPLFADFSGFPPTLIQVGSHEILRSDATRLRRRMLDAGVLCRLEEWENLWHVFQMFPIKKAEQAMEQAGAFLLDGF